MGFKPMSFIRNIFQYYEISKTKASKIQVFMVFKHKTKYFPASKIAKKKAYENIEGNSMQHSGFYGIQNHDLYNKIFSSL